MKVSELQRALEVFAKYAPLALVRPGTGREELHVYSGDGQTQEAEALVGMVQYDLDRLERLNWRPARADEVMDGTVPGSHWVAKT